MAKFASYTKPFSVGTGITAPSIEKFQTIAYNRISGHLWSTVQRNARSITTWTGYPSTCPRKLECFFVCLLISCLPAWRHLAPYIHVTTKKEHGCHSNNTLSAVRESSRTMSFPWPWMRVDGRVHECSCVYVHFGRKLPNSCLNWGLSMPKRVRLMSISLVLTKSGDRCSLNPGQIASRDCKSETTILWSRITRPHKQFIQLEDKMPPGLTANTLWMGVDKCHSCLLNDRPVSFNRAWRIAISDILTWATRVTVWVPEFRYPSNYTIPGYEPCIW